MQWKILNKGKNIIKILLENRKIKDKEEFLNPPMPEFFLKVGKAIKIIKEYIEKKLPIVVYGDYDVDGICATAIMWETLYKMGAKVMPFIPQREKEGYGLSKEGIDRIEAKLIIVVDSGIVAHEAVEYAKEKGIKVIIIDHHEKPKKLPKAFAIIHTDKLCATGLAYFVNKQLTTDNQQRDDTLELAAIATVADLMPLTGVNRSIVKHGLKSLGETQRPGLRVLFEVAGIKKIGTYEIGYMIGPRLNAAGRIDSALTGLRLICTKDVTKAKNLADQLNEINKERQKMLEEGTQHAFKNAKITEKIIVIEHEMYHQGIIGLIAGKLTEKYYLPAIVISKGEKTSKASARSISGFNIIEAIRAQEELLINAGGHPMAAGFTIETSSISNFKFQISNYANKMITADMLEKTLKIDCELDLKDINMDFYNSLAQFAPYGLGNPEPVFASTAEVSELHTVGEGKHLKLSLRGLQGATLQFEAIYFNGGSRLPEFKVGEKIRMAYSLDLNTFNGTTKLQLKVKDIIKK